MSRLRAGGIDSAGAMEMIGFPFGAPAPTLSPRSDWREMSESEHFVQFYETDAYLLYSLCGYIATGLKEGDAGIILATRPHREELEERLRDEGLDVPALIASGQYVPLDAAELLAMFMREGSPQPERFAELLGGVIGRAAANWRRVRIFGELVALLWAEGNHAAAIRVEELWNRLHETHAFSLFCAYPMRCFEGEAMGLQLRAVCGEHTRVIPAESYNALAGADERLRAIALLQQKAASLEAEVEERKRVEEKLKRSLQLRDDFLSAISHDLKTPLTVLQGQAQMMQRWAARGTLDEATLFKGLEQIESKSRMMTELINDLLDVTRLRAGEELQLDRQEVDLVSLVQDEVASLEEATDAHRLTVVTEERELIGCWDRRRLRRVVENLLDNAIKYSPAGGEVTVTLAREAGSEAVLTVRDQGMGIGDNDLPHIFEQFYRGKNAASGIRGTGIGLAGVRRIVEQHGGTIGVESREGEGSAFTVRLPLGPVQE